MEHPPGLGGEHRLAVHKLFDAVFAFAWRALDRHKLSPADRDDIAQNVAVAVLTRWSTYREECGTPGQWLWGIVRNEHRAFLRAQARQPVLIGDDLLDVPSEAPSPEESASLHGLGDHLLATLPIAERRVVTLYEIVGLTYREIAAFEGISKSEAHERHQTGMRSLVVAATRSGDRTLRGVVPLPLVLAELAGTNRGGNAMPPPEVRDRAWERACATLGLGGPGTGLRNPGSRHAGRSFLRRVLPTAAALLGGLLLGGQMERARTDRAAPATAPASAVAGAGAPADDAKQGASPATPAVPPSDEHSGEPLIAASAAIPTAQARTTKPAAPRYMTDALAEQALMDKGRAGLISGNLEDALAAFAEHARRFPRGQGVTEREQLRERACAQLRSASAMAGTEGMCLAEP